MADPHKNEQNPSRAKTRWKPFYLQLGDSMGTFCGTRDNWNSVVGSEQAKYEDVRGPGMFAFQSPSAIVSNAFKSAKLVGTVRRGGKRYPKFRLFEHRKKFNTTVRDFSKKHGFDISTS